MSSSVTELALLSIPAGPLTTAQLTGLAEAKTAMERFSGQPFTFLLCQQHQISSGPGKRRQQPGDDNDDPNQQYVFIVGGWPSVEFHMEKWIPSEENQALLRELGDVSVGVAIRWMWHVGMKREVVEKSVLGKGKGATVRLWRGAVPSKKAEEADHVIRITGDHGGTGAAHEVGKGRLEGSVAGWRLDDGFLAEGEAEKSFRKAGATEELVFLGTSDDDILSRFEAHIVAWTAYDCVVLDV
jgi:hypothetical protein